MSFKEQQYQVYLNALKKDRGSIKWSTSMMLQEHVALLKEEREKENCIPKPQLAEWELEDMQLNLMVALNSRLELEYKIWNDGKFEYHRGVITRINEQTRELYYSDPFFKDCGPINIDSIVDIQPLE